MNVQIDFLKRCKELGLHEGSLFAWLEKVEQLIAENEALKQQVEQGKRDAERWNWWKKEGKAYPMRDDDNNLVICSIPITLSGSGKLTTVQEAIDAMIAAAPQPEPVDVEPAMWVMKHIRSGDLAQAKPNQKALHPYMWSDAFPRYTTPQPDRVAELEAALKVARDGIDKFLVANDPTEFGCACDLSVGYLCGPCHADKQQQPLKSAIAKINEVLHD